MTQNLSRLSEKKLLALRFCDLNLSITDSILAPRIEQLLQELSEKGLLFRPHFWISTEWFSPDGVPGIAVPFYLMHPRLVRLERSQMYEVEGYRERQCMQILRHEAGHAIDFAFRLHRRKCWREVFGSYSRTYPETYTPKPLSKKYVQHLDGWYAQAHPAEDFAETFAVWLNPKSKWKKQYAQWPALDKLHYVDSVMKGLQGKEPKVQTEEIVEPIESKRMTLGRHYQRRRDYYGVDAPDFSDAQLLKIFSNESKFKKNKRATQMLKEIEPKLRPTIADWTGTSQYTIAQVLMRIRKRCQELDLRLQYSEKETRRHCIVLLTLLVTQFIYSGKQKVSL